MKALICHGGAGAWKGDYIPAAKEGVKAACEAGVTALQRTNDALKGAVAAVMALEDNPTFNAGTGSVLGWGGSVEMDAAVMRANDLATGAVALVTHPKNPVLLARAVMERTDHALLVGPAADDLSRALGLETTEHITERRRKAWGKARARVGEGDYSKLRWKALPGLLKEFPELFHGTVGAVAVDDRGRVVAATSTGGVTLNMSGRVGDTPLFGAGTYAEGRAGCSATGVGEHIIRIAVAARAVLAVNDGMKVNMAAETAIAKLTQTGGEGGLILADNAGNVGYNHNCQAMPVAYWQGSEVTVRLSSSAQSP